MQTNPLSPAGCRRHTRALAWVREMDEDFEGTQKRPGEVLSIVKKAGAYIGMNAQHEILLDKLFMLTQPQDWTDASPVGPVVFGSNEFLADETNRSVPTTKRLLSELIAFGLICPRDSANGRRWGRRDEHGQLVEAYGFSLSPCAARFPEFAEAAERRIADRKERGRLKATITREKKRIAAAAAKAEAGWELFQSWLAEVAAIISQRARANLKRLRDLAARMTELRVEAEAAAELSCGPDPRAGWRAGDAPREEPAEPAPRQAASEVRSQYKSTPEGLDSDTPITATQHLPSLWDSCGSRSKEEWSRVGTIGPNPELVAEADLEKHGVTPGMVLSLVTQPRLSDLGQDPSWSLVHAEATQLAEDRRLDRRLTAQLAEIVGRQAAAVAIITTARKADRWEVRNEGGYLRRMLEIARSGELRMGRTVWGLIRAAESDAAVPA